MNELAPLSTEQAEELHAQVPEWEILYEDGVKPGKEGKKPEKMMRTWKFADFAQALAFANRIGELAEKEEHHPDLGISWGKLVVELSTHSVGGLSKKDFALASKIDALS